MYESEAMYHEEQDKFLNAAVKVRLPSPLSLLSEDSLCR
jgi:7,8-dihydro-6-hydroxymethylpterin-pyrophosphokinase